MTLRTFTAMCLCTFVFIFASAGIWNARLAELDLYQQEMGVYK